ncbi:pantoate--beta-alanine ligase [Shewanella sp. LC6]|jgi:pantoate--beta-alanine ligase|uniref:pantoate--beta-alanine ligase n=1 Tax=Shewanella TaxID=22 RepID=UPI0006DB5FE2|nr:MULTISPECIES: pantoate--beta-alanine ligase [unclassified Shewanella]ASF15643.1 pantoate--beta-alanine ligase [Shewanella sp. FDAARGOS_354]KPN75958.1 pantoate--beta-alanine ligase [Shewanella sp. Sh95]QQK61388.1 pantoate--beta-alanine ligase [Shewanella sp. LC6]TPE52898.1 pantoate--beta-alanine ligase [Shewanella sp. LC2]
MITSAHIDDIRTQVRAWRAKGETVAFVPTMGNLHQGHITLVKEAAKKCDHVVVSIFVNPMQFGQNEDLDAYPRTLEADSQALTAAGAELLFTPTPAIIYPKGLAQQTYVEVPGISDVLCGASRPGHFRGVATIVCKLFNIVQPDVAFFGNKDYQQLLVIRTMVEDLSLPIEIIGIDTIREASGLAMSSRNGYLTAEEKAAAPALKKAIDAMAQGIKQGVSIKQVTAEAKASLIAAGFTPDYLEVRHATTLAHAEATDQALVILAAAYLGKARLIDNLRFDR